MSTTATLTEQHMNSTLDQLPDFTKPLPPFTPEAGKERLLQFREAHREAMSEEMRRDDRMFLMGEEVAQYNGAYKISQGMLDEFGPKRIIEMIPENGMGNQPRREVRVEVIQQRPKLGMQVEEQTSGKGLKVLEVKSDAPAAKAGLKVGDVVEKIDGQSVNNLDELRAALEKENKSHKLNIIRAGKSMELTVTFLRKGAF